MFGVVIVLAVFDAVHSYYGKQRTDFLSDNEESNIGFSPVLTIELDIPDYLPEELRHPTKFFSGRKIFGIGG